MWLPGLHSGAWGLGFPGVHLLPQALCLFESFICLSLIQCQLSLQFFFPCSEPFSFQSPTYTITTVPPLCISDWPDLTICWLTPGPPDTFSIGQFPFNRHLG